MTQLEKNQATLTRRIYGILATASMIKGEHTYGGTTVRVDGYVDDLIKQVKDCLNLLQPRHDQAAGTIPDFEGLEENKDG